MHKKIIKNAYDCSNDEYYALNFESLRFFGENVKRFLTKCCEKLMYDE